MWKMLGMSAGQAALATAASKVGQMAVESVWPDGGARSEEPYAIIKRELQIASREINEGNLQAAHERIIACSPTAADVRFWLSKSQIRKMREWQRGGQQGRRCCGDNESKGQRAHRAVWERGTVTVSVRGPSGLEMDEKAGEVLEGLGIHKEGRMWHTIHLQSGLSLGRTQLKREARAMAQDILAAVPDVGEIPPSQMSGDQLQSMREIAERYRGY